MAHPPISILYVVDGQRLEAMSLVFSASLARHHAVGREVALKAYVRNAALPDLSPATRAFYGACGVEIAPLPEPKRGLWAKPYPHGNKIIACAEPRDSQRSIFLDTDMVCTGPITDPPITDQTEVMVVPEGKPTWGREEDRWARAYAFIDQPLPEARVKLMRGKRRDYLPYYNAGFISFGDGRSQAPTATNPSPAAGWTLPASSTANARSAANGHGWIRSPCLLPSPSMASRHAT